MQTEPTQASQRQQNQFSYIPRLPEISTTHPDQRYFEPVHADGSIAPAGLYVGDDVCNGVRVHVHRHACNDYANLTLGTRSSAGTGEVIAWLKAQDLRVIAQCLLDAAHDLEANPLCLLQEAA